MHLKSSPPRTEVSPAGEDHSTWLAEDRWLAELVGKPCYRILLVVSTPPAASDRARQRLDEIARTDSFVYAKVPTDDKENAGWLRGQAFVLVETALILQKTVSVNRGQGSVGPEPFCVRPARPDDADKVAALAARAFSLDRFHSDPLIPNATADCIKARWARGFFHRERGDAMIVAEADGAIVGFNQLVLRHDGSLVIDLIAVAPEHRGCGIATAMVRSAEAAFDGIERVVVETQIANKPSVAFYQAMGFRLADSKYVFHRHGAA
jgi:ribosomal protein S18 acetylase RimI-like enzyme